MGTIKDIVDLSTQLASRVKDRKIAQELNQIQVLILQLQSEQALLHEKNMELREEKIKLNERVQELTTEIQTLNSSENLSVDAPHCPNCSTSNKPYFMSPLGSNFSQMLNATHRCSKCDYRS